MNQTGSDGLVRPQRLHAGLLHGPGNDHSIDIVEIVGAPVRKRLFPERHPDKTFVGSVSHLGLHVATNPGLSSRVARQHRSAKHVRHCVHVCSPTTSILVSHSALAGSLAWTSGRGGRAMNANMRLKLGIALL